MVKRKLSPCFRLLSLAVRRMVAQKFPAIFFNVACFESGNEGFFLDCLNLV